MTGQFGLYELRAGDVLANRFRIVALLGIGGMGLVYRGHDQALDVDVAIKLLRPELARKPEAFERFRQELLLARQVSSPHVVRIHDIAEHDGRWFITMDFIDGDSLEKRLDGNQKLPTDKAIGFAHDLLDGLSAAHQRGVVHRDLKPANVLIDAKERAYITDFGVARSLGATGLTHSGVIIGTPEYLSPEQARGETVDARSDLYADRFDPLRNADRRIAVQRRHTGRDGDATHRPPTAVAGEGEAGSAGMAARIHRSSAQAQHRAPFSDRARCIARLGNAQSAATAAQPAFARCCCVGNRDCRRLVRHG